MALVKSNRHETDELSCHVAELAKGKKIPDYFSIFVMERQMPRAPPPPEDISTLKPRTATNKPTNLSWDFFAHNYSITGIARLQQKLIYDTFLTKSESARQATITELHARLGRIRDTCLDLIIAQSECPKCHGVMLGPGNHDRMPTKKLNDMWNNHGRWTDNLKAESVTQADLDKMAQGWTEFLEVYIAYGFKKCPAVGYKD